MTCEMKYSREYFTEKIKDLSDKKTDVQGKFVPWCLCNSEGCGGNVKPDIVFFGEGAM